MVRSIDKVLLRVDLTTRKVNRDKVPEEDVQMFLGGRVLGDMLLYNELAAGIEGGEGQHPRRSRHHHPEGGHGSRRGQSDRNARHPESEDGCGHRPASKPPDNLRTY